MPRYYLHRNGQNHGPYDESQISAMLATLEIQADELICEEGGSKWKPASTLAARPSAQLQTQPSVQPQVAGIGAPAQQAIQPLQPQKQGMNGCLKLLLMGVGFLVIIGIVGFYLKSQDDNLREYGIAKIEGLGLEQNKKLISLALAEHCHLRAVNSGNRTSKKSLNTVSETEYWSALQNEMKQALEKVNRDTNLKDVAGNSYLYHALEEGAYYVLKLDRSGKYETSKFWTKPKQGDAPTESTKGSWKVSSDKFVMTPASGSKTSQKILIMSRAGFIVKVSETSANFWKLYR